LIYSLNRNEYRKFNLACATTESGLGRSEEDWKRWTNWDYIYIETTQGNSLCSYLYLKLAKMKCFSFYLLCFFFKKIGEQEGRTGSAGVRARMEGDGLILVGGRRSWGKR
jgi:hypothetical protein